MKTSPSQNFRRWLEEIIANPSAGEKLPTVSELTQRFHLSRTWVMRNLKPYISNGTLTAIRGRGTFVTSRMAPPAAGIAPHRKTTAESIADALTEDIAAGKLKHGDALPAVKLLCSQFNAGHANVTRAYRMLTERGLARKVGRYYWVGGLRSLRSFRMSGTIPWFNFSEGDSSDVTAETDIGKAYETLELELHNHRLGVRFEACRKPDLFLRPDAFAKSDCSGVIISGITGERFAQLRPRLEALGPELTRSGKRILLCGSHPDHRPPGRTHYFCHGTIITNVVRTAAESCFTKGFQDIVLLFSEKESITSDLRFLLRFVSESRMRNPKARITFLIQPVRHDRSPENVFKRTPSFTMFKHFGYLEDLLSKYQPFTMGDVFDMVTLGDDMDELLSRAPRTSVWLTTAASTACKAVQWCATRHVRIPSEVSILCFDRERSLTYKGIATCLPDWHTIGYLMAHTLIGDIPITKSRKGFLRTPAVLCERCTMR